MRLIGIIFSSFFSIVFLVPGLISITLWYSVLNPDLYTTAIDESEIIEETTKILESYATAALGELTEEVAEELIEDSEESDANTAILSTIKHFVSDILEDELSIFVNRVFNKLHVSDKIQEKSNEKINYTADWLKGKETLPAYIENVPSDENLNTLQDQGFLTAATSYAAVSILGINDLRECSTQEDVQNNLNLLSEKKYTELTCKNNDIIQISSEEIQNQLPPGIMDNLETRLRDFLIDNRLEPLYLNIFDFLKGLNTIKYASTTAQTMSLSIRTFSLVIVLIGIAFSAIAIYLGKQKRIRVMTIIYSGTGLIILFSGYLYRSLITKVFDTKFNLSKIDLTSDVISEAQNAAWLNSITETIHSILFNVYDLTISVGWALFLIPIIIIFLFYIYKNEKVKAFFSNS